MPQEEPNKYRHDEKRVFAVSNETDGYLFMPEDGRFAVMSFADIHLAKSRVRLS